MRAVTVREAEFSDADRLLLLASKWADGRPRGRHGFLMEEAMDPANANAFVASGARVDYAQSAWNAAEAEHARKRDKGDTRAFLFEVSRKR